MNLESVTARYSDLRIGVVGDFCLDRYLEIDPARKEISIETGLPVHNVVGVRSQPGAAGTILNNLVALGTGAVYPIGFCGEDGEGFELIRSLRAKHGLHLDYFIQTDRRRTFTYTKPLLVQPGKPPVELNRLDLKNWSPTPPELTGQLRRAVASVAEVVDAFILLDQVDIPETGVITGGLIEALGAVSKRRPELLILADGRRGLRGFPPFAFKMNAAELGRLLEERIPSELGDIQRHARKLAGRNQRAVFVTLAERGMVGAGAAGEVYHAPALPVRGEIDVVGAGDAVTANLAAALAAGASLPEAMQLAMLAASIVVHQLGTTGTASARELIELNQSMDR